MRLTLKPIGNSTGLILPKKLLDRMNLSKGDDVFITETRDGFAVSTYNEEFEQQMKIVDKYAKKYRNTLRKLAE